MDRPDTLARLEALENSLLSLLQEARGIRTEIEKNCNGHASLDPLLAPDKVAEILGVDVGRVYALARARKIPSMKVGKYLRFSPSKLKKWLDRKNDS